MNDVKKVPVSEQVEQDIVTVKKALVNYPLDVRLAFARLADGARHSDRVLTIIKENEKA